MERKFIWVTASMKIVFNIRTTKDERINLLKQRKLKTKKINSLMNYQNQLFTGACTCFGQKNKINYIKNNYD